MKMSDARIKDITLGTQVWYIGGLYHVPTVFTGYIKEVKGVGFYLVYNNMGCEVVKHFSELTTDFKTTAEECIRRTEKIIESAQSYINNLKEQLKKQPAEAAA